MKGLTRYLFILAFIPCLIMAEDKVRNSQNPKPTSSPSSMPSDAKTSISHWPSGLRRDFTSPSGRLESWNIRFQYVNPALDEIFKYNKKCAQLADDQKAFDELYDI